MTSSLLECSHQPYLEGSEQMAPPAGHELFFGQPVHNEVVFT